MIPEVQGHPSAFLVTLHPRGSWGALAWLGLAGPTTGASPRLTVKALGLPQELG